MIEYYNNSLKIIVVSLSILLPNLLFSQIVIKGKVIGLPDNRPIPGSEIIVEGTTYGTTADFDGEFELNYSGNLPIELIVSFKYYKSKKIRVDSTDKIIIIELSNENEILEREKDFFQNVKKNKDPKGYIQYFEKYYPQGEYVEKAQKKGDELVYEDAINRSDYTQLLQYQKYFSKGAHIQSIKSDLNRVADINLNKVINSNLIADLEKYIKIHKYAVNQIIKAKERIAFLEHKKEYQAAVNSTMGYANYEPLFEFLRENKNSIYYDEGIDNLYKITLKKNTIYYFKKFLNLNLSKDYKDAIYLKWWDLISKSDSINQLEEFIKNTTNPVLHDAAKRRIETVQFDNIKKVNTIKAYEKFLKDHPAHAYTTQVSSLLNDLLDKDRDNFESARYINSIQSYEKYLNDNPHGKFRQDARRKIEELPKVSNIVAKAVGSMIEISFYVTIEEFYTVKYLNISNDRNIPMQHLSGDFEYTYSGQYSIVWDVLQDTNALEGNVTFNIELETQILEKKEEIIDKVEEVEIEEEIIEDVPFTLIEDVPVYPGCTGNNEQLRNCLNQNVQKFIAKKFNTDLAQDLGLSSGKKRIFVMFKIDKNGNIADIQAKGPHRSLEAEAIRVVNMLPKMEPGKQRGRPIGVKYSLPISFIVNE